MQIMMTFAALVAFTTWALWKETPVPFMVAGAISIVASLSWYDQFGNNFGLAVSLVLLAFAFYCFAVAFKSMFAGMFSKDEGEE